MRRNRALKFICEHVYLRVEQTDTPFTSETTVGQVLRVPIAHGEGNYHASPETLAELEANRQVVMATRHVVSQETELRPTPVGHPEIQVAVVVPVDSGQGSPVIRKVKAADRRNIHVSPTS